MSNRVLRFKSGKLEGLGLLLIFIMQFINIPAFGDIDKAGKLFTLFAFTIIMSSWFICKRDKIKTPIIFFYFAVIWIVIYLSNYFSIYKGWSYIQLGVLTIFLIYFLITYNIAILNKKFFEYFVNIILIVGVVYSVLGVYEYYHFYKFGISSKMLIPYILPPDRSWRVVGTYGQPNLLAVFYNLCILAFFYKYIHSKKLFTKIFFVKLRFVPVFIIGFVFMQTGSRAGLLSFLLTFCLFFLSMTRGRYLYGDSKGKRESILIFSVFVLSMIISNFLQLDIVGGSRYLELDTVATDARYVFWATSIFMFLDHSILGVGLGNWQFFQNGYGLESHDWLGFVPYEAMGTTNWAHNELLQILAELGIVPFLILVGLVLVFTIFFVKEFINTRKHKNSFCFYSQLFLLPFLIQSMFSWPFRYPPLLLLFFTCLGFACINYRNIDIHISSKFKSICFVLIVFSVFIFFKLAYIEVKIGRFAKSLRHQDEIVTTLPVFRELVQNPYSCHRVLSKALPFYVKYSLQSRNIDFAKALIPYAEKMTVMEGARWHWHNLALLYLLVGDEAKSRQVTQHTLDLMPSDDKVWDFMHYLNIREASRKTGRPIEYFYGKESRSALTPLELIYE